MDFRYPERGNSSWHTRNLNPSLIIPWRYSNFGVKWNRERELIFIFFCTSTRLSGPYHAFPELRGKATKFAGVVRVCLSAGLGYQHRMYCYLQASYFSLRISSCLSSCARSALLRALCSALSVSLPAILSFATRIISLSWI